MYIDEFEGFVSSIKIGDKVFYYNKNTGETAECIVEYAYIRFKHIPCNDVIELFLRDIKLDEVIRLTDEDAEADTFELFPGGAIEMFNDAENYLH